MPYFDGLNEEQILEMAREDWRASRQSRVEIEEEKLEHYRLYRRFRTDVVKGEAGPFGWSKLSVPLVFWIVETVLPRVGINLPVVNITAKNPAAVPYQQAKELRMRHLWNRSNMKGELFMAVKSVLIMGEGFLKLRWDRALGGPTAVYVPWFDVFASPEATTYERAEFIVHRTWHTPRGIKELIHKDNNRRGPDGKKLKPLYDREALEQVIASVSPQGGDDPMAAELREAAGLGVGDFQPDGGQISLCEIHYKDGSMAMVAGDETPILVRHRREPLFKDEYGRPIRPFCFLQNTPDLFNPAAISTASTVADFQREITALTNMAMDQSTRNLMAPKGVDDTMVDDISEVIAAFSVPGGTFRTKGDPLQAVRQFEPGQLSTDYERMDQSIRNMAQLVSGVSDIAAGMQTPGGLSNETALGASILREESNMRFRLLLALLEQKLNMLAHDFHCMDRHMSPGTMIEGGGIDGQHVTVQLPSGMPLPNGAPGMQMIPEAPGWAKISPEVNGPGIEYNIEIAVGSLAPPSESESARKMRALLNDILSFPPPEATGVTVNWGSLMRRMFEAHGEDAESMVIILPPAPPALPGGGSPTQGPGEAPVSTESPPMETAGSGGISPTEGA